MTFEQVQELARRFQVIMSHTEDGYYSVDLPEWPDVITSGDTYEEAAANAIEALACHIEDMAQAGEAIPEPLDRYSGMVQCRLPDTLHRALAARAKSEKTSLNGTIVYLLTQSLTLEGRVGRQLAASPRRLPARAKAARK